MRSFWLSVLFLLLLQTVCLSGPKKPRIAGQKKITTTQGQAIGIRLSDLIVEENEDDSDEGEDDDDENDEGEDKDKDDKDKDKDDKDKDGKDRGNGDGRTKAYPAGYSLEILTGANYQISGNSVLPNTDFIGDLSVGVRVNNEKYTSNTYKLTITVNRPRATENKAPVITDQLPLSTPQNTPVEITLGHLIVSDDDSYPNGFSLHVNIGANHTVSGNTVTPNPGFTGILWVGVTVNDGKKTSNLYSFKITVTEKTGNVRPVITGQVPVRTTVNRPVTIQLSQLKVTDPDNSFPADFTLKIATGNHYSVNGNVITPENGFKGRLIAKVTVNDGASESMPFDLLIDVEEAVNVAPVISGQVPLSISKNQAFTITFSHLSVTDPDNQYPADFSLTVLPGNNYQLTGSSITPSKDFTGELTVPVSVSDGSSESKPFNLKIRVTGEANVKPVITGQVGLKIIQGQTLEVKLVHLAVRDPDNEYPEDFTLQVSEGANYTTANGIITPAGGYVGNLHVKVSVSDGANVSDPFTLLIEVVPQGAVQILGQEPLRTMEDSSLVVMLSHLIVSDPSNNYPGGYSLQILTGDHYKVNKASVIPDPDFSGNLTVPVRINRGSQSASYSLLIIVEPVNDAPVLLKLPVEPLVAIGQGPWALGSAMEITDVDDDELLYAEVGFQPAHYDVLNDALTFKDSDNIKGVFDPVKGILFLLGRASVAEYENVLRSVSYSLLNPSDTIQLRQKTVYLRLSDGEDISETYERTIVMNREVALDIPDAFTPNNDTTNDTWKITPLQNVEKLSALIRVYNQKGLLVFQTNRLETEWDGKLNGDFLPADVYYYTIEMDVSYTRVSYKGIVAILR